LLLHFGWLPETTPAGKVDAASDTSLRRAGLDLWFSAAKKFAKEIRDLYIISEELPSDDLF
jgi:hypothetical protein